MSKISEQIKHLNELSETARMNVHSFEALSQSLREAADTIETLSTKLQATNMERSEVYYGGRKQSVNIQLNKGDTPADIMQLLTDIIDETNDRGYAVINAFVDGVEVYNGKGFSKDFFDNQKENHEH